MLELSEGSFSYEFYNTLIRSLKTNDYSFIFFTESTSSKHVYLRHDVDIDIFSCMDLCKIENENGVKSTWFLQPDNDLYNMLSSNVIKTAEYLVLNGGEIGLHINAGLYHSVSEMSFAIEEIYTCYCKYLPLSRVISFHRPGVFLQDFNIKIPGMVNVYEDPFFSQIAYVSDSNRRRFWEEPLLNDAVLNASSICLLTHPIWWKKSELSDHETIDYVKCKAVSHLAYVSLKNNIKRYSMISERVSEGAQFNE